MKRSVPIATALAMLLGVALRWPALFAPFHSDDYEQLAMLHGEFLFSRPVWDLFWFGPRSPAELERLVDFGFDPWWTVVGHRLSMWRPLPSLLIALDDALFGSNAVLWHVHSFAWFLLLVGAVGTLFGRVLLPKVAACAVLVFALDSAHSTPLTWLANRSTLIATGLGTLALLGHLAWRERSARSAGWLSGVLWLLAFGAGEYAFGMFAYLVAYEALAARDAWAGRLRALAPATAAAFLYLVTRSALGHGAGGGELYVSPGEPLRFLERTFTHGPVLAGDLMLAVPAVWWQIGSPWREWLIEIGWFTPARWTLLPDWSTVHVAIGALALAGGALCLRWLARVNPKTFAQARWLACGSLLSLVVVSGTAPSARLLAAPALGAAALLAAVFVHAAESLRARPTTVLAGVTGALFALHGLLPAQRAYADTARVSRNFEALRRWAVRAEIPRRAAGLDIVAMSTSDFATGPNLPWSRWFLGFELPRSYRVLSGAQQAHELECVDAHTLELTVLSTELEGAFTGSTYRGRNEPLHAGQVITVRDMRVELLAVDQGNPFRFRVRFGRPLSDPSLLFIHAQRGGLRRLALPPPGQKIRLPRAALPWD